MRRYVPKALHTAQSTIAFIVANLGNNMGRRAACARRVSVGVATLELDRREGVVGCKEIVKAARPHAGDIKVLDARK